MSDKSEPKANKLIVYGTPVCPMVPPVRNLLKRAEVDYDYVDISRDQAAREVVLGINGGNQSVPTLVFPDGETMTEPSNRALRSALETRGHTVAAQSIGGQAMVWMQNPALMIGGVALLGIGLMRGDTVSIGLGAVFLVANIAGRLLNR